MLAMGFEVTPPSRHCHGTVTALSRHCHGTVTAMLWQCHGTVAIGFEVAPLSCHVPLCATRPHAPAITRPSRCTARPYRFPVTSLSCHCHVPVIFWSYPVTSLSRPCHIPVIFWSFLSRPCHVPVTSRRSSAHPRLLASHSRPRRVPRSHPVTSPFHTHHVPHSFPCRCVSPFRSSPAARRRRNGAVEGPPSSCVCVCVLGGGGGREGGMGWDGGRKGAGKIPPRARRPRACAHAQCRAYRGAGGGWRRRRGAIRDGRHRGLHGVCVCARARARCSSRSVCVRACARACLFYHACRL